MHLSITFLILQKNWKKLFCEGIFSISYKNTTNNYKIVEIHSNTIWILFMNENIAY